MTAPTHAPNPTPVGAAALPDPEHVESLRHLRIGVRAVLALGVAASVAANVLHAQPTLVGRCIAAWPPLALLLTVELISRVPVHSRRLTALRLTTTAAIAGIAAWVSYWHMVDVAATHGEGTTSAHLIPLSVDGLVIVASICLVEIGGRLRALTAPVSPAVDPVQGQHDQSRQDGGHVQDVVAGSPALAHRDPESFVPELAQPEQEDPQPDPQSKVSAEPRNAAPVRVAGERVNDTAAAVARIRRRNPSLTAAEIAARLDVHPSTVRRHLAALNKPTTHTRTSTQARTNAAPTSDDATASCDDTDPGASAPVAA